MQRVRELDAMRGLAAIAIVVYHLWVLPISLLGAAVDLFFVLSGYLITSIILSHPPSERFLLAFYVRRGLRIWPIYYLSLFVVVAINPWTPRPGSLGGLPYFLTFTQNLPYYWSDVAPSFITAFRHTWSLAVEEQFYIVWPALLWVVGRKGLGPAALSLVALATVTRSLDWYPWILATHRDGLALGALLAGWIRSPSDVPRCSRFLIRLGTISVVYWVAGAALSKTLDLGMYPQLFRTIQSTRVLSLNVFFYGLVGLTVLHAGHPRLSWLRDRRLVYFGQISYGFTFTITLFLHTLTITWHFTTSPTISASICSRSVRASRLPRSLIGMSNGRF
jgi:peptidoglycan/LPS O-acetylase OafA/YrhL